MTSKKQLVTSFENHLDRAEQRPQTNRKKETAAEKKKRIDLLLSSFEDFCYYYFPKYTSSKFADFHREFSKEVIQNDIIFITRAWARDHAKSVTVSLLLIYLTVTKKIKNCLLFSKTESMAIELLSPVKKEFEENEDLQNDFGQLKGIATWTNEKFITKTGVSFRAIGTGQSPRGSRNDEARPDIIVGDDTDDDEVCRNPERLENTWQWMMGALFGAFSIGGNKRFILVGNIIAKDSLVVRASQQADSHQIINILNEQGLPSWQERFTLEQCQYMIEKMGTLLSQREYFNNPQTAGSIFKSEWMADKELPPLTAYKILLAYLDPAFFDKKTSDHKALILIGLYKGEYHIIKAYCDITSISQMIAWHYDLYQFLKNNHAIAEFHMEEVFLQPIMYNYFNDAAKQYGFPIPLKGDKRKKPNKDVRIASLSGYFERGKIYFNAAEAENHHMKKVKEQFVLFSIGNTKIAKDGCDAVEGAIHLLNEKIMTAAPMDFVPRKPNNKRV